jgi:acetyl esterase/lipase
MGANMFQHPRPDTNMMKRLAFGASIIASFGVDALHSQTVDMSAPTVRVTIDGTVHTTGVTAPLSHFVSEQLRAVQAKRLNATLPVASGTPDVLALRTGYDKVARDVTEGWQKIWPATIAPLVIDGVQTVDLRPINGIAAGNAARVLINLHGGGFFAGGRSGGWSESVPVAGRGRIRVITVDYRLDPEHRFPAASEDVAKVYRALLKKYKPSNIGIFGCSAGGALVAQSLAWFQSQNLPRPGAAGIFCSGAMPGFWNGGDTGITGRMLNGQPQVADEHAARSEDFYLTDRDMKDPLISPALFPDVLSRFPPTLFLTGTRDVAMSNALVTHARLLAACANSQLEVQEGLGLGEFNTAFVTPEAMQAMDIIWTFFDTRLGRR